MCIRDRLTLPRPDQALGEEGIHVGLGRRWRLPGEPADGVRGNQILYGQAQLLGAGDGGGPEPVPPLECLRVTLGPVSYTHLDVYKRQHQLRSARQLAIVRELWETRDSIARRLDRAPGRVLSDLAISEVAARATPERGAVDRSDLRAVKGFSWRIANRYEESFVAALATACALTKDCLLYTSRCV